MTENITYWVGMFLGSVVNLVAGRECPDCSPYGMSIPTSVVDGHSFHTVRLCCRFPVVSKQVVLCTL